MLAPMQEPADLEEFSYAKCKSLLIWKSFPGVNDAPKNKKTHYKSLKVNSKRLSVNYYDGNTGLWEERVFDDGRCTNQVSIIKNRPTVSKTVLKS